MIKRSLSNTASSRSHTTRKATHTIGAFITGDAELELLYGIIDQLKKSDVLDIRILAYSHFVRRNEYCKTLVQDTDLEVSIWPKHIYRILPQPWLNSIDALLLIEDPKCDMSKSWRNWIRNRYLQSIGLPTIFFQHGIIQSEINIIDSEPTSPVDFYSDLIFVFEDLGGNSHKFSKDSVKKINKSGFIKKAPITPLVPKYLDLLCKYEKKIIFAHDFSTNDYTNIEMSKYFAMVKEFALGYPNFAVIVRPHRGKEKKWHKTFDDALRQACPNVIFSNRRSGLLKGASMADLLSITDYLVTPPSTAILEALNMNIPIILTKTDLECFEILPIANDFESLETLINNINNYHEFFKAFRDRYGNLDDNIKRTCKIIESYVSSLPRKRNISVSTSTIKF